MADIPTVLLVDDYPDTLDVWALYLRGAGFAVLTAADGPTALELASRERPDIVVMDLELPGLSGFDVARSLQMEPATRHIPLLAATVIPAPVRSTKPGSAASRPCWSSRATRRPWCPNCGRC